MNSTRLLDIFGNLGGKLLDGGELAFVTQALHEFDLECCAIEIGMEVEEVYFDTECLISKRGIVSYVCHPGIPPVFPPYPHNIDAGTWYDFVEWMKVRRRKT